MVIEVKLMHPADNLSKGARELVARRENYAPLYFRATRLSLFLHPYYERFLLVLGPTEQRPSWALGRATIQWWIPGCWREVLEEF